MVIRRRHRRHLHPNRFLLVVAAPCDANHLPELSRKKKHPLVPPQSFLSPNLSSDGHLKVLEAKFLTLHDTLSA
jgi:hypothetical protein